jgi:predicted RNase H-like HicB family nuclease
MTDSFVSPKTYVFPVDLAAEPDGRWSASCPALPGCATWAWSRDGALQNIQEAVEAYVEDMQVAGEPLPAELHPLAKTAVTVTL